MSKKPLRDRDGELVLDVNGKPQRFTQRAAIQHGRGGLRHADAPRVSVRDVGSHWVLDEGDR
jgi:hypothetical protein